MALKKSFKFNCEWFLLGMVLPSVAWVQEGSPAAEYAVRVHDQLLASWVVPRSAASDESCSVALTLNTDGEVREVKVRECASIALANSLIVAAGLAVPFPQPPMPKNGSSEVTLTFVVPAETQSTSVQGNIMYPDDARRAGEEGHAKVEVHLSRAGLIESIEVVESTGFPRLDKAAPSSILQLDRQTVLAKASETACGCWTFPVTFVLHVDKSPPVSSDCGTENMQPAEAATPRSPAPTKGVFADGQQYDGEWKANKPVHPELVIPAHAPPGYAQTMALVARLKPGESADLGDGQRITLHHRDAGLADQQGWFHAISSEGGFSARLPGPYSDATLVHRADDGGIVKTDVLASVSRRGTYLLLYCSERQGPASATSSTGDGLLDDIKTKMKEFQSSSSVTRGTVSAEPWRGVDALDAQLAGEVLRIGAELCRFEAGFGGTAFPYIPDDVAESFRSFRPK